METEEVKIQTKKFKSGTNEPEELEIKKEEDDDAQYIPEREKVQDPKKM